MRLIDADALKEAFYQKMKELLLSTDTPQISYEALSLLCGASLIADAPTIEPEPQWIPCSERLPDTPIRVQVQLDNGWIITAYRQEDEWLSVPDCEEALHDEWVIAWMPLPEPYKEK